MIKMISAIITAAACAGLIVSFVPGFTSEVAAGATQSVENGAPSSTTINAATAIKTVPTVSIMHGVTDIRRPGEQNLSNGSRDPKIVCEQSWPYYEPSCLHDGYSAAGNARVIRVISADRSPGGGTGPTRR